MVVVVDAVAAVVSGGESGLDSSSTGVALSSSLLSSSQVVPQYGSSSGGLNTKNNEVGVDSTRMQKEAVVIHQRWGIIRFSPGREGGRPAGP